MKFALGDSVQIIDLRKTTNRFGLTLDSQNMQTAYREKTICTIVELGSDGVELSTDDWNATYTFHPDDLELVIDEKPKFKVGDRVRIISTINSNAEHGSNGNINQAINEKWTCTIDSIINNKTNIRLIHDDWYFTYKVHPDDLELVSEEKPKFKPGNSVRLISLDATTYHIPHYLRNVFEAGYICKVSLISKIKNYIDITHSSFPEGCRVHPDDLELIQTKEETQTMKKSNRKKSHQQQLADIIVQINGNNKQQFKSMQAAEEYAIKKGNKAVLKGKKFNCKIYSAVKTVAPVNLVSVASL